jgi:hypothetical protein
VPGLLRAGHSVAILRHRLVPAGEHPAAIQDVARGVAVLLDRVAAGEFDSECVFLAGHSSGAQLALMLALDPTRLEAEGKRPEMLAGVLSISGIVDLSPGSAASPEEEAFYFAAFPGDDDRRAASPSIQSSGDLPSFLFIVAARDLPGYRSAASRRANALRSAGHISAEVFVANGRDHFSILELADSENDARRHVLPYLASRPRSGRLPDSWQILSTWRDPPFTTADFHVRFPDLIETYRADTRFNTELNRPFRTRPGAQHRITANFYQSIPLIRLLEELGTSRIGTGEWLEIRNARGEWAAFSLARLRELSPLIVISVDGEKNLFRATDLYHTQRRYSWVDPLAEPIDMARPLGAFLYFPERQPTPDEGGRLTGRYALTTDSFRLRLEDPVAGYSNVSATLRHALFSTPGCVGCHQFRGVGGRALHLRAKDGAPMGGHALPLERYPALVWKRFIFDQRAVAEEVGASPIQFEPGVGQALYDLIVAEKERGEVEPWIHPDQDGDFD